MPLVALETKPGVVKSKSDYDAAGRWIASDKIRDIDGEIQTIGGYQQLGSDTLSGCPRGSLSWRDTNSQRYAIFGTHTKVYRSTADGVLTNITPFRSTGTLGTDPFDTTSGDATVTVTHTSHGLSIGDTVVYSGATATGGLTIDGTWTVATTNGANEYTFEHTSTASSTASGGGSSADFSYEISIGLCDGTEGFGYGGGPYGTGFYGAPRPSSITLYPRTWSYDRWGEDVIGTPKGGEIYLYDTSAGGRMAIMSANAPTALYSFVTKEQHVVALGADGDPFRIENSDQNDYTTWTATATNQANGYSLPGGDPLMSGRAFRNGINVVWTRHSCWTYEFLGQRPYWQTRHRGTGMGIFGPHAHVEFDSRVYWMSDGSFFMFDGVQAREVPAVEEIRDWVFADINRLQREKCWGTTINRYSEICFFYCSESSVEIDRAVTYCPKKAIWFTHTWDRTTGFDRDVFDYPIWVDSDGMIYEHEIGQDADGSAMQKYIERAPDDIGDGNVSMDVQEIIPDLKDQAGDVTFTLYGRDKPNSTVETFGPYTATTSTTQLDVRADGRQMGMRVESNTTGGKFRLGKTRIDVDPAGGRD